MKIRNVTRADLDRALEEVNETYNGNVIFDRIDCTSSRKGVWEVTLRTVDSRKAGGRRVRSNNGRRVITACWHAHGRFFDALPPYARYYTWEITGYDRNGLFPTVKRAWHKPGDEWVDLMTGSLYGGMWMTSELCNCDEDGLT